MLPTDRNPDPILRSSHYRRSEPPATKEEFVNWLRTRTHRQLPLLHEIEDVLYTLPEGIARANFSPKSARAIRSLTLARIIPSTTIGGLVLVSIDDAWKWGQEQQRRSQS